MFLEENAPFIPANEDLTFSLLDGVNNLNTNFILLASHLVLIKYVFRY